MWKQRPSQFNKGWVIQVSKKGFANKLTKQQGYEKLTGFHKHAGIYWQICPSVGRHFVKRTQPGALTLVLDNDLFNLDFEIILTDCERPQMNLSEDPNFCYFIPECIFSPHTQPLLSCLYVPSFLFFCRSVSETK